MRDYLGEQVARSLTPVVAVRPRLLSVFERPRAVPGWEADLETHSTETVEAIPPPARPPAAAETGGVTSVTRGAGIFRPPAAPDEPPLSPPPRTDPRQGPATLLREIDRAAESSRPTRARLVALPPTVTDAPPTEHEAKPPAAERSTVEDKHGQTAEAPAATHPTPAREQHPGAAPVRPVIPAPVVVLAHPPRPPRERATGVPSVPSIQVTIGRVEIRATPAAEKARARPAKPPALGLDEYLRRRAAGGAR